MCDRPVSAPYELEYPHDQHAIERAKDHFGRLLEAADRARRSDEAGRDWHRLRRR